MRSSKQIEETILRNQELIEQYRKRLHIDKEYASMNDDKELEYMQDRINELLDKINGTNVAKTKNLKRKYKHDKVQQLREAISMIIEDPDKNDWTSTQKSTYALYLKDQQYQGTIYSNGMPITQPYDLGGMVEKFRLDCIPWYKIESLHGYAVKETYQQDIIPLTVDLYRYLDKFDISIKPSLPIENQFYMYESIKKQHYVSKREVRNSRLPIPEVYQDNLKNRLVRSEIRDKKKLVSPVENKRIAIARNSFSSIVIGWVSAVCSIIGILITFCSSSVPLEQTRSFCYLMSYIGLALVAGHIIYSVYMPSDYLSKKDIYHTRLFSLKQDIKYLMVSNDISNYVIGDSILIGSGIVIGLSMIPFGNDLSLKAYLVYLMLLTVLVGVNIMGITFKADE